jgi:hypothetical protein
MCACGSHNSSKNKDNMKFWQEFLDYYGICYAKHNQNWSTGTWEGHRVSIPWNDRLKFKLVKKGHDTPHLRGMTLANTTIIL